MQLGIRVGLVGRTGTLGNWNSGPATVSVGWAGFPAANPPTGCWGKKRVVGEGRGEGRGGLVRPGRPSSRPSRLLTPAAKQQNLPKAR